MRCFEDLVDFSQAAYLDRIQPVTRATAGLRGLNILSVMDGNYLLDGGAERLVSEWKVLMGRLIDRRDGEPIEDLDANFDDLLHKSGSASYEPKIIDGMSRMRSSAFLQVLLLSKVMASKIKRSGTFLTGIFHRLLTISKT